MGSRYVSFTAAADPSAVAAARVIRPSSRSRRGRCKGRSASPNKARGSPQNIRKQRWVGETLRFLPPPPWRRRSFSRKRFRAKSTSRQWKNFPTMPIERIGTSYTRRLDSIGTSGNRPSSEKSPIYISAAVPRHAKIRRASRTCALSLGSSAGRNVGSCCQAGTGSERRSKAWLAVRPRHGMRILREMYREWPFFQTLLSNMDMVLAKSNIAIASRYAELVEDTELREAIFPRLRAEWQYTIEMLLAITGQQALLDQNPLLARSIKNRFPYLDPLNHVQIELLKRHRAGDTDDRVVQAIHLTINGIAAGLRNSG